MVKVPPVDHDTPLQYFIARRRELVEQMAASREMPPNRYLLADLAETQQAITASEAVIAENNAEG